MIAVGDDVRIAFGPEPGKAGSYRIEVRHNGDPFVATHSVMGRDAMRAKVTALAWLALDTAEAVQIEERTWAPAPERKSER